MHFSVEQLASCAFYLKTTLFAQIQETLEQYCALSLAINGDAHSFHAIINLMRLTRPQESGRITEESNRADFSQVCMLLD